MKQPYLLFLGNETELANAKTASGIAYWRPEICIGQYRQSDETVSIGIPDMNLDEAYANGARTLIIGIAPSGGYIAPEWVAIFLAALEKGYDIAAGLHQRLNDHPEIAAAAKQYGRQLFDVRQPTQEFDVGTGAPRPGKRLLTVGTDCAVGKMYASLAIEKELKNRGINASFRATGQTGIFITGRGISVDAVVSDFVSGSVEWLAPANDEDHWDIIEGQGALGHPSYAAVTLGLLHGSQADKLVLCHDASRSHIADLEGYPLKELGDCMDEYVAAGKLTNKNISFAGISVNTSRMSEEAALAYMKGVEEKYALPCCDPVRTGVAAIVDNLLAE